VGLLGPGVEAADVIDELRFVANLFGRSLGRDLRQESLGVRNVELLGNSARDELGQKRMEATDHPGAMTAEVPVALGQQAQDCRVISLFDAAQIRSTKGGNGDREGVVGVVLVGTPCGEHADARGQGGRDIEHLFTPGNQLLGQQVAQAASRLDGPGPLLERLGPTDQLVDLAPGRSDPDARDLVRPR
jgi:hypothetical protein